MGMTPVEKIARNHANGIIVNRKFGKSLRHPFSSVVMASLQKRGT